MSYQLSFISDQDLRELVEKTVQQFKTGMTLKEFHRNIVDPIKLTFDVHVYGRSIEEVIQDEILRQLNKSNENLIGYFHQNIFKYLGNGWEVPGVGEGWDVENHEKNIFAEFKNKHNTMNSSASKTVHARMQGLVEGNSRATCYLVEIIAKRSQNIPWQLRAINLRADRQERLRRISVDQFYELATDEPNAFLKLCSVLGKVIDDVIKDNPQVITESEVLQELKQDGVDVLKNLFVHSFKSYRGIDEFKIRT